MNLVKSSFTLNLTILRLLGLYPRKQHSKFYLLYGFVLMLCCIVPDPVLSSIYYIQNEELTILDAGVNLVIIAGMLVSMPKMLPFIINKKEVKECFYYLDLFVTLTLNDKQTAITNECIRVCRRNNTCFFFCVILDSVMWTCRPLFFLNGQFPIEVWLPFDPTTNRAVFYCIYVIVAMGMVVQRQLAPATSWSHFYAKIFRFMTGCRRIAGVVYSSLFASAVDPLISGLAYHAAGQIKILKDNLEFLFEFAEKCSHSDKNQVIYAKIQECVRHHQQIISFVHKVENCFSWVIFSQFFLSISAIGLCCLQITQETPGSNTFYLIGAFLVSVLVQIYFYCYYGATLYEESKSLPTAAYLGRWYEYDLKSQKALVLFMERAKIPTTLTVWRLFDLSLETFTLILKKSYSLLAVLQNY